MKWHYAFMRERQGPILKRYPMFVSWGKHMVSRKMVVAELYLLISSIGGTGKFTDVPGDFLVFKK